MTTAYAFRDSAAAAERLRLVAEIFEPTSRTFLAASGRRGVGLALDLGCGPGYTTRLLAAALRPRHVIGLDSSAAFLDLARRDGGEYRRLDVESDAVPPADLAYCRFLLSHVRRPAATVERWVASLRVGGRLLAEEVESISTDDPAFARYLDVVRAMLARRGHTLEVGPNLVGGAAQIVTVAPDPAAVARMFRANLRAWSDEAPDGLDEELAAGDRGPIVWRLRRIVHEKEAAG
jgi:trans-aconitate 2-methyltransferase